MRIMNTCITVINKNLNGASTKAPNGKPKGKSLADAFQDADGKNDSPAGLPQLNSKQTAGQLKETGLSANKRGGSLA